MLAPPDDPPGMRLFVVAVDDDDAAGLGSLASHFFYEYAILIYVADRFAIIDSVKQRRREGQRSAFVAF